MAKKNKTTVRQIRNDRGIFLDVEEIVHSYNEFNFNEAGLFFNDALLVSWEEIDKISKEMRPNETEDPDTNAETNKVAQPKKAKVRAKRKA